jgi:AcrR family transcriptional regulator
MSHRTGKQSTATRSKVGVATRNDRRRDRTRTALLLAGRKLLATRDVEGVSIDEIVAAADVAKGSFYNYFADKEVFAREIGSQVRRQAEVAVQRANAGVSDPAAATARALCVFMRFAVEHRDSAQVLWRLNSGATLVDAPINRNLREIMTRGIELERFKHVDLETGVLVVMGTVVIALRHALEDRVSTSPMRIAESMSAALLRALGLTATQSAQIAARAANDIFALQAAGDENAPVLPAND